MLLADGYDATGVDPNAPDGAPYRQAEFEHAELPGTVDALVASTSLHHVADPAEVLDRITQVVRRRPRGRAGMGLGARRRETARWCFSASVGRDWLQRMRDEWRESASPGGTTSRAGSRRAPALRETLIRHLDKRLEPTAARDGPYFFAGLAAATEGQIEADRERRDPSGPDRLRGNAPTHRPGLSGTSNAPSGSPIRRYTRRGAVRVISAGSLL
jgi:hypothetical protein